MAEWSCMLSGGPEFMQMDAISWRKQFFGCIKTLASWSVVIYLALSIYPTMQRTPSVYERRCWYRSALPTSFCAVGYMTWGQEAASFQQRVKSPRNLVLHQSCNMLLFHIKRATETWDIWYIICLWPYVYIPKARHCSGLPETGWLSRWG